MGNRGHTEYTEVQKPLAVFSLWTLLLNSINLLKATGIPNIVRAIIKVYIIPLC